MGLTVQLVGLPQKNGWGFVCRGWRLQPLFPLGVGNTAFLPEEAREQNDVVRQTVHHWKLEIRKHAPRTSAGILVAPLRGLCGMLVPGGFLATLCGQHAVGWGKTGPTGMQRLWLWRRQRDCK